MFDIKCATATIVERKSPITKLTQKIIGEAVGNFRFIPVKTFVFTLFTVFFNLWKYMI